MLLISLTKLIKKKKKKRNNSAGTSLVIQWLRIHLPMHGMQVQSLVRATAREKPVRCNERSRMPQLRPDAAK